MIFSSVPPVAVHYKGANSNRIASLYVWRMMCVAGRRSMYQLTAGGLNNRIYTFFFDTAVTSTAYRTTLLT